MCMPSLPPCLLMYKIEGRPPLTPAYTIVLFFRSFFHILLLKRKENWICEDDYRITRFTYVVLQDIFWHFLEWKMGRKWKLWWIKTWLVDLVDRASYMRVMSWYSDSGCTLRHFTYPDDAYAQAKLASLLGRSSRFLSQESWWAQRMTLKSHTSYCQEWPFFRICVACIHARL